MILGFKIDCETSPEKRKPPRRRCIAGRSNWCARAHALGVELLSIFTSEHFIK
jgi:hypothetical protein